MIIPEAADMCMIDAVHEGRVVRAAVRVEGVPHAGEIEERLRRRTPSIGHPLPLLLRDRIVEPVGQPGPLLGAPVQPNWDVTALELSRGDQLVLDTDGVTEARGERDRFGEERLRDSLSMVTDATQTVAQIERALDSFLAGPPSDDAAMVVIQRPSTGLPLTPSGSPARAEAAAAGE